MSPPAILVAVDISDGSVVRLVRGEASDKTVYSRDPVAVAGEWQDQGAEWLHVVDLDAAFGTGRNSDVIGRVLKEVEIPVQVSGGIRSTEEIGGWLGAGATRVCIGTKALDPKFVGEAARQFGDALVVAVDARGGEVRVEGWTRGGGSASDVVRNVVEAGARRLLFTDIDKDGTMEGPNLASVEEVIESGGVPVIASGGIESLESIRRLASLGPRGLEGMIIGKALYSRTISLRDAMKAAAEA